jgi:hypothetical protein
MESEGTAPPFLTSALDGGEWSASRPDRFTPGERSPGTHWIGGLVGPQPVWTLWRSSPAHTEDRTSAFQPVARRYTDCAILENIQDGLWVASIIWQNMGNCREMDVFANYMLPISKFRILFLVRKSRYGAILNMNSKKLFRYCQGERMSKGGYVFRVGGTGNEWTQCETRTVDETIVFQCKYTETALQCVQLRRKCTKPHMRSVHSSLHLLQWTNTPFWSPTRMCSSVDLQHFATGGTLRFCANILKPFCFVQYSCFILFVSPPLLLPPTLETYHPFAVMSPWKCRSNFLILLCK